MKTQSYLTHTQHSMEEEKQLFDEWYKEQKEMTPYIMRDYFLSRINLAVSKERERIVDRIKEQAELYNGVSEYFCPDCKIRIGRWSGKVLKDGEVETRFGYIKSQN